MGLRQKTEPGKQAYGGRTGLWLLCHRICVRQAPKTYCFGSGVLKSRSPGAPGERSDDFGPREGLSQLDALHRLQPRFKGQRGLGLGHVGFAPLLELELGRKQGDKVQGMEVWV